ncbi:SURF1 family protein [Glutamicibacter sp. AOP33-2CA-4]|uniref:SURF1 family protein n=1 Tax=Glutamicibacter sp. AOP33-2CA-4 TaxID=3457690 RepID=UPI0040348664
MLKTALKPKWIAALLGALLVATGFVALSGWQFGASSTEPAVKIDETEVPVPLTEHYTPGVEMLGTKSDQIVTLSGEFLPGTDVLVEGRVDDDRLGSWVVAAFAVDGAPDGEAMAVVRGWQPETGTPSAAPEGTVEITGRLLPPEGPELNHDVRNPALATLSTAQLANIWDQDLYSGFVTAHALSVDGQPAAQPGIDAIYVGPQPQEPQINWLNVFYGIEWVVFAGFAVFLWYRLVRDDYQRGMDDIAEAAAQSAAREKHHEN